MAQLHTHGLPQRPVTGRLAGYFFDHHHHRMVFNVTQLGVQNG
ncbi:MAG: hypothetical protein AAF993_02700 [Pseudomonadota bacterium]